MRTIAITNQKGGSAKTTTAVNLAAALAERRQRVLVIDLDPQASASAWLGVTDDSGRLLEALTSKRTPLEELARPTLFEHLDVIPGSLWTVQADTRDRETRLRDAIGQLPTRWDVLLVDCPPSLGFLAIAALGACREVLVPVEARVMALAGLAALMQTVDRVKQELNPQLAVSGILACRVDVRTNLSRDVVQSLRQRFGSLVFTTTIRETVRLAEAPSFHQPITQYAPDSAGAEDYRAAAREFTRRTPRSSPR